MTPRAHSPVDGRVLTGDNPSNASTPDQKQEATTKCIRKRAAEDERACNTTKRQRLSRAPVSTTSRTRSVRHWVIYSSWPPSKMLRQVVGRKATSRGRKRAEPSDASSLASREASVPYADARYTEKLEQKGCFLDDSRQGLSKESDAMISTLLDTKQTLPAASLFDDDLFELVCRKVGRRNEARVVHDITPLLVPAAEELACRGKIKLTCLVDSFDERWTNCLPLVSPTPQPDVAVGFAKDAFTSEQFRKLSFFIGDYLAGDRTYFMATYLMFFPFLTCEVKCGTGALDTADRQNAHSMTVANRALAYLYRQCGWEHRLEGKILGFSISHDHQTVRLYAHYVFLQSSEMTYHRHTIRTFSFTELKGRERWSSYTFVKNIYELWAPAHLEEIRSALDALSTDPEPGLLLDESSQGEDVWHFPSQSEVDGKLELEEARVSLDTSFSDATQSKRQKS